MYCLVKFFVFSMSFVVNVGVFVVMYSVLMVYRCVND